MNTKSTIGTLTLAALLIWNSSHGQVIIEGGTFGAKISNRDGLTLVPASTGYTQRITPGTSFIIQDGGLPVNSPVRNITSPPGTTRTTPVITRSDPGFQPVIREINIKQIQRIKHLEKELGVIKTTKTAWIALDWNLLFSGKSTGIRSSSKHLLNKVNEYMALTRGKSVSVTYDYLPGADNPDTGVERSIAVVNYLQEKSGMSVGHFCVCEPKTVKPHVVEDPYNSLPRPPARSVVNIRIQR